jgi:small subunit ribosomal protein S6
LAVTANREYELVLMLDPEIPEERREQIASEARTRIESGGSLKHDASWGMRKLAYEIRQRTEADYRLFRFETGGELLDELNHNLRIADGVLRFRIFKVDPGSPAIVPPAPVASSGPPPGRGSRRPQGAPARESRTEQAPAAPAEPQADAPTETSQAEGEATAEPQADAPAETSQAQGEESAEPQADAPAETSQAEGEPEAEPAGEDSEPPAQQ